MTPKTLAPLSKDKIPLKYLLMHNFFTPFSTLKPEKDGLVCEPCERANEKGYCFAEGHYLVPK